MASRQLLSSVPLSVSQLQVSSYSSTTCTEKAVRTKASREMGRVTQQCYIWSGVCAYDTHQTQGTCVQGATTAAWLLI
jgi:hypothetical protein